jgi:hypothetical protein
MLDQGTGLLPAAALVRFDVNTGIEFKSSSAASQMFPETVKGNPGDFAPPQPTGKEGRPVKTTLEATEFTSSFPMMPTPAVTTTYYYNVKIDFAPSPGSSFQSCLVLDPRIMNP